MRFLCIKQLVIGMVEGLVTLGVCGCNSLKSDAEIKEERQEYAQMPTTWDWHRGIR